MSRSFALFAADNLPSELKMLAGGSLVGNSRASEIMSGREWITVGTTADTSIGEKVPQAFQAIMILLGTSPKALDEALTEQIVSSLSPATPFVGFPDEPAGIVCNAENIHPFLDAQQGKEISYFWY